MQEQFSKGNLTRLDQLAAAVFDFPADVAAIEFEHDWLTWGDLTQLADQVGALLDASQVVGGSKVALVSRNHPAILAAFIKLVSGGFCVQMIYPFQSPQGIAEALKAGKPAAVLAMSEDFSSEMREAVVQQDMAAIGFDAFTAYAENAPDKSARDNSADDEQTHDLSDDISDKQADQLTIDLLTSGTTGKPKPFSISFDSVVRDINAALAAAPSPGQSDPREPALLYFPIGNISGLYSTLPAILSGRRIVLLERFNIHDWRDFVVKYRPVAGGLPPAGIQMLLDEDVAKEDLASLRMIGAGAAPLDPEVQKTFQDKYNIPILLAYGATEFGGPVVRMTPDLYQAEGKQKLGSVGKPMAGVKLRVIDPNKGEELKAGQEGILEVVSPRIGEHWIRTTDLAVIDDDGYLFIRGRADGAIFRGGFKILPETVEQALVQHPAVSAAAVVGIKDHRLGQVPVAAVVLKEGAKEGVKEGACAVTEEQLKPFLRERVLATHIPTQWRFVKALPRTELSYKVNQSAVRALFE